MAQARAQVLRQLSRQAISWNARIDGREPCRRDVLCLTHPEIDTSGPIEQVPDAVRQQVAGCLSRGHIPVTLGGEHSLTFGAVMGIKDSLGALFGIFRSMPMLICAPPIVGPAAFSCQCDASLC